MHGSPDNESPVGAMPEATEQKNDAEVAISPQVALSIAAQRNVEVIPEPFRKSNMPPPPKLSEADLQWVDDLLSKNRELE